MNQNNKMKTLVCTQPRQFEYMEAEKPELVKGNSIIKIKRIGICGTDLHAYEGTQPFFEYPRILGHELSGELIEIDDAPGFQTGLRPDLRGTRSPGVAVRGPRKPPPANATSEIAAVKS